MSLIYSRILCRRGFEFASFRSLYTSSPRGITRTLAKFTVPTVETHDQKNAKLKRPMSPHLTIYQPQLTTILSITHRATGMILFGYAVVLASGALFLSGGIPNMVECIEELCLPMPILFLAKYFIALPATYHYFNGIRHLAWDLGHFLTIKYVYSTGYAMLGMTVVSALILAAIS